MTAQYISWLALSFGLLGLLALIIAPRTHTAEGFFLGRDDAGNEPGVWTLTFSQVTTWIFARSLLNAGILGYFFGIAGALAYTAYYGSFLTGWLIVDRLRFRHGAGNIQGYLRLAYGKTGDTLYNILIAFRLLSEVFANLLVVGIIFGSFSEAAGDIAILGVALLTLLYSMMGGLRASLRTDILQMALLGALLFLLTVFMLAHTDFSFIAMAASSPQWSSPGWTLLLVALVQVLSYPLHDPVMMDRGFLASRSVTRKSFFRAFWMSAVCIFAFGSLGVFVGLQTSGENEFLPAVETVFGLPVMFILSLALLLSAASTMDSTFSSASKMIVSDMGIGQKNPTRSGRLAMLGFALFGLFLVFYGTDDLFAAVAVSGTASMFLTPVILFNIFWERQVRLWSLVATFTVAICASATYFLENSGKVNWIGNLTGVEHSYSKLLLVVLLVLVSGIAFYIAGLQPRAKR